MAQSQNGFYFRRSGDARLVAKAYSWPLGAAPFTLMEE
jgi:hypothetical protein